MAQSSKAALLGLLLAVGSASAATVGPIRGKPVTGRPLEVNIPFAVDDPTERACASANVRYGSAPVSRSTLHVQGHGLKRNLLVTSPANVNEQPVTVNVRVGCGAKAVSRSFLMLTNVSTAKAAPPPQAVARQAASELPLKAKPRPVALTTPAEPLFPPPAAEALPAEGGAAKADASLVEELHKAKAAAAAALAQLAAVRKELAAVLDVERRTSQTLINADHQVRDARSEVARMRSVLMWTGAGLALAAAGAIWLEFQRVMSRRRTSRVEPAQEPTILATAEMPT